MSGAPLGMEAEILNQVEKVDREIAILRGLVAQLIIAGGKDHGRPGYPSWYNALRFNDEAVARGLAVQTAVHGLPCAAEVEWNGTAHASHECAIPNPDERDEPPSVPA